MLSAQQLASWLKKGEKCLVKIIWHLWASWITPDELYSMKPFNLYFPALFFYFNILKQVPIDVSCLEECCHANQLGRSRNVLQTTNFT